jgi:hypothetical protein
MAMVVAEERLKGPYIQLLVDELLQLKIMRDRVDHPRKGSKDLADAVCGSIYNAISRSKFDVSNEIDIHTYDSLIYDNNFGENKDEEFRMNLIRPPKMPSNLEQAIESMTTI